MVIITDMEMLMRTTNRTLGLTATRHLLTTVWLTAKVIVVVKVITLASASHRSGDHIAGNLFQRFSNRYCKKMKRPRSKNINL